MPAGARPERGVAVTAVLLAVFLFVSVGVFIILSVNRPTEMRGTFQKSVAGFQAAGAGIDRGAASVLNEMSQNLLPAGSDCNPQTLSINQRAVTYTLSPCGQPGRWVVLPSDDPFAGVNANVYTYTLAAAAVNMQGFTEANRTIRFDARRIPIFQFAAFYQDDLVYTPDAAAAISGRMHTNGDMYVDSGNCGSASGDGSEILGRLTIVGSGRRGTSPLNRGSKSHNGATGHVYISPDGTADHRQILGVTGQGDVSCGPSNRRRVAQREIEAWNGRVRTGIKNLTMPAGSTLFCAPWDCPRNLAAGANTYWQKADLRIVLDLTAAPAHLSGGVGPALPPVNVLDALGNMDAPRTAALHTLMRAVPGVITYSDVPTSGSVDCRASVSGNSANCERTYGSWNRYAPTFPTTTSSCPDGGLSGPRSPRALITEANYCNDYRYGGFYNWRESKPILMLNVDWMALEEYNRQQGNVFFDPAGASNNGLVVFLSVKGPNAVGANNYGVRIYDAARVRRDTADLGITFASDLSVYVAGTFNCPQPAPSGGLSTPPTCGASGSQKPASIVADTVNVLSCAWMQAQACGHTSMDADQWPWSAGNPYRPYDENSTQGYVPPSPPPFSPGGAAGAQTFVNAALFAGSDQIWCPRNSTGLDCGSQWAGDGFPYIRFHEDWTGQPFWYQGSLVEVGAPLHTCYAYTTQLKPTANDGAFSCRAHPNQGLQSSQRYAPPVQHVFYDAAFDSVAGLPPLTPVFVSLKQARVTDPFQ